MMNIKNVSKIFLGAILSLPVLFFSFGCQKSEETKTLSPLEQQGKASFVTNCIACHNPDPRMPGSVGPDIAGSSLELVTARVMHRAYPPGYKPKRATQLMPELPFLEKDIPALHAYLNSFIKK